jgi:hypothetical protein
MVLSQELSIHCRETLLQCSEFDSDALLQAVFETSELRIYKNSLPQCDTKEHRVDQTIAYLLPVCLSGSRPAFPLLLAALREHRPQGDALRDDLDTLHTEVAQVLSDKVIIPFVIAAMTQAQVVDLMDETIFGDPGVAPAERVWFREFKQALQQYGCDSLQPCYGADRESWKPLHCPDTSIREIILDILEHINNSYREPQDLPRLLPSFLSKEFFASDRALRRQTLKQLRQLGGILIVDAISMFHPMLRQSISQSGVCTNRRVAIVVVSPVNTSTLPVNRLIEQVIDRQLETAFTRFEHEFDRTCEIGVSDLRSLKRWLYAILPETAANVQEPKPSPGTLQQLQQMRNRESIGIHRKIYDQVGV